MLYFKVQIPEYIVHFAIILPNHAPQRMDPTVASIYTVFKPKYIHSVLFQIVV